MTSPFDACPLIGRTFGSVLDEIAPWSGNLGFAEDGPITFEMTFAGIGISEKEKDRTRKAIQEERAVRRKLAPIVEALREETLVLVDVNGVEVPRWVWFSGRWRFYRDDRRGVERLAVRTETGQTVEYYNPRFAWAAAKGRGKKPARSRMRGGGNTRYDDTAFVEQAQAEYRAMPKPSKSGAAAAVIDRLIKDGHPIVGPSREAWIERVRRKI